MEQIYASGKTYNKNDFADQALQKGEYENCRFNNCDFSKADFSEMKFTDCGFSDCNLSMARLNNTAFRGVQFKGCKMLGLRLDDCNKFGLAFSFENCSLNLSSFYKMKIKQTLFRNSQLQEVDLAECDLTASVFDNCDFLRAIFDHTIIEKADLRTSYNFSIDPGINRIRKARFSLSGLPGLLYKYDIEIER